MAEHRAVRYRCGRTRCIRSGRSPDHPADESSQLRIINSIGRFLDGLVGGYVVVVGVGVVVLAACNDLVIMACRAAD